MNKKPLHAKAISLAAALRNILCFDILRDNVPWLPLFAATADEDNLLFLFEWHLSTDDDDKVPVFAKEMTSRQKTLSSPLSFGHQSHGKSP